MEAKKDRETTRKEQTIQWIHQALARGYCTDRNSKKVLDSDLIKDMAEEVYQEGKRQFVRVI